MFRWKWCWDDVGNRFRFEHQVWVEAVLCDWQRYDAIITEIYGIYRLQFFPWCFAARASRAPELRNKFFPLYFNFQKPLTTLTHIDHNVPCLRPLPPPNVCIIFLSNFSRVLRSYQEESKTMVRQNLGGWGEGKQRARIQLIQYFPIFQFPVFQFLTRIAP